MKYMLDECYEDMCKVMSSFFIGIFTYAITIGFLLLGNPLYIIRSLLMIILIENTILMFYIIKNYCNIIDKYDMIKKIMDTKDK